MMSVISGRARSSAGHGSPVCSLAPMPCPRREAAPRVVDDASAPPRRASMDASHSSNKWPIVANSFPAAKSGERRSFG